MFSGLLRGFRPLSSSFSVYVIAFRLWGSHGGGPHDEAKKPSESHFYVFPFLLGVRVRVFVVFVTPMRCFRPQIVVILKVCVCVFQPLEGLPSPIVVVFCICDCL